MKQVFLLIITLCFIVNASAQVKEEWIQRFGGIEKGSDVPAGMIVNDDGSVVVGGSTESNTLSDFITIKYNSAGVQQWAKAFSGQIEDRLIDICNDNSGNIYVTGLSENQTGTYDIITIKYNSHGDSTWVRRYDSAPFAMDQPTAMMFGADNFLYVTGYTFGAGNFTGNVTIKYNSDGDSVWVARTVNGSPLTTGDIYVDAQSNVYVYTRSSGTTIIKYDISGNLIWKKSYGFDPAPTTRCMTADISGNIFLTGKKFTSTFNDFATVKINPDGDTLWMRIYNCTGSQDTRHDESRAICLDESGNVYVTGESQFQSNFLFSTVKYNSNGIFQWEKTYFDPSNGDGGNSIAADDNGGVYITGGSNDMTTIKYNSGGDSIWLKRYNGPSSLNDISEFLALDKNGNVYISGRSRSPGSPSIDYDIVTIKYSQTITTTSTNNYSVHHFRLYQNYPNPFNPKTIINYELENNNFVSLDIYNSAGVKVSTLISELKVTGSYSVEWDASNFPSGIYYCKLTAGDYDQVKKMILLK